MRPMAVPASWAEGQVVWAVAPVGLEARRRCDEDRMRVSARAVESEHDGGDEDDPGGDEKVAVALRPQSL